MQGHEDRTQRIIANLVGGKVKPSEKLVKMQAYSIDYKVKGDDRLRRLNIDARDLKSARRKIARRHGFKNEKTIQIQGSRIIAYF
jgi:hypothetical protein